MLQTGCQSCVMESRKRNYIDVYKRFVNAFHDYLYIFHVTVDGIFPNTNISMIKINMAVVLSVFFWSVILPNFICFHLTVYRLPQSFSIILLIENLQTVTVSFQNETFSICVLIYGQTVENYREIHHFLALIKVLINQLATSAIVVFCMTYCLYTVKWNK
jgi:hypothetical protein